MDTNIGIFKMLELRIMAGDELKDDVSNATLFFKRSSRTFCISVGLYDRNQHCQYRTLRLQKLHLNILCRVLSDQAISMLIQ